MRSGKSTSPDEMTPLAYGASTNLWSAPQIISSAVSMRNIKPKKKARPRIDSSPRRSKKK